MVVSHSLFIAWVDDFFDFLEDAARLGQDVLDKIADLFGFTKKQMEDFKKAGFDFVTLADDAVEKSCRLCRIVDKL